MKNCMSLKNGVKQTGRNSRALYSKLLEFLLQTLILARNTTEEKTPVILPDYRSVLIPPGFSWDRIYFLPSSWYRVVFWV